MNLEEYNLKVKEIEDARQEAIRKLVVECALSNNTIEIGQIVEDHIGKVKVEKIRFNHASFGKLPSCRYWGIELKKDGTPKKRGDYRDVYQSNLLSHE